jgi:hypothetical protein
VFLPPFIRNTVDTKSAPRSAKGIVNAETKSGGKFANF